MKPAPHPMLGKITNDKDTANAVVTEPNPENPLANPVANPLFEPGHQLDRSAMPGDQSIDWK